ncbi:MAG: nickel pincer cofactor biosynthesis protein LarB, partial [Actinomycetota bacterium]
MPEAIYGEGKSVEQCIAIVGELLAGDTGPVLLTRVSDAVAAEVTAAHPGAERKGGCLLWRRPAPHRTAKVLVISAGTSDVPVVDECVATLEAHGFVPDRVTDVGVAGLHRLLARLDRVQAADAIVVVAGMEGALASVIGGLTAVPVVAVPTSVGHGAGL